MFGGDLYIQNIGFEGGAKGGHRHSSPENRNLSQMILVYFNSCIGILSKTQNILFVFIVHTWLTTPATK